MLHHHGCGYVGNFFVMHHRKLYFILLQLSTYPQPLRWRWEPSAIESPFLSFDGEELYPTVQSKAVRLGYGLIKNHCMIDGNKRIGAHAMLVLLKLNGIELKYTQRELYETILEVADGSIDFEGLLRWVLEHQK